MIPDVTIIIPCYKVGQYLKQGLESVLNQSHKNIQVVAINDASPDDTAVILNEYAARDPRLKVIHQKVNAGVSVARNIGMSEAIAPFLIFLDGDDYLPEDAVTNLLNLQRHSNADLVCANARQCSNDGQSRCIHYNSHKGSYLLNLRQGFGSLRSHQRVFCGCIIKLFRTSLIQHHNITFDAKLRYGEDTLFTNTYIIDAHPLTVIDYDLETYCYRQNPSSIVHAISLEKRLFNLMILIEALDELAKKDSTLRWLAAEKSAEYLWAIRKFSVNTAECQKKLRKLVQSDFFHEHIQPVLSRYGKFKHRILLKLFKHKCYWVISLW